MRPFAAALLLLLAANARAANIAAPYAGVEVTPAAVAGWTKAVDSFFASPQPSAWEVAPALAALRGLSAAGPDASPEIAQARREMSQAVRRAAYGFYAAEVLSGNTALMFGDAADVKLAVLNRKELAPLLTQEQLAWSRAAYRRRSDERRRELEMRVRETEDSWKTSLELGAPAVVAPAGEGRASHQARLQPYRPGEKQPRKEPPPPAGLRRPWDELSDGERAVLANNLHFRARAAADADPTGVLLERDVLPLFARALEGKDTSVRVMAARHLQGASEAAVRVDPTGRLWNAHVAPLFERALADDVEAVRTNAAVSLRELTQLFWQEEPPALLFGVAWKALVDRAYGGGAEIEKAAEESLGALAMGALTVDPSGALLEKDVLPLVEKALASPDQAVRVRGLMGMNGLEFALKREGQHGRKHPALWARHHAMRALAVEPR